VLTARVPGGPDRIFYREPQLYQGEIIRCQSDHGDYACSHRGVVMSDSDGMDSGTQMFVAKRTWAPVVMSLLVRH
jgi:hypothetical protein